jgi:hypothetical protein
MSSGSRVDAVILSIGNGDNCIPTKVEVHFWVLLMPGKRGGHARDARRHGGCSVEGTYKAQVLQFHVTSTAISRIQVQHAYMHWYILDLDLVAQVILGGANCKSSDHLAVIL